MPSQVQISALHAVVRAAQAGMRAYGVPASVTLAQWALESGWGTTGLAKQCRNYFGIKAEHLDQPGTYKEFPTHEFIGGVDTVIRAKFECFDTDAACFEEHGRLLSVAARYKPAMEVKHRVAAFCAQLQFCGYSTAPNYAERLNTLIRQNNLTQYDLLPPAAAQEIAA